jgi:type II secretory pathway pseudopilin PulG
VSLVEALVAVLVLGFGMLAIAGFQASLSRNAEVARQRTEATRLAREKLETLRSFERIAPAAGAAAYEDLASGSDAPALASNTNYERRWTVAADALDSHRRVQVHVRWAARTGDGEDAGVVLQSVIARADPRDAGALVIEDPSKDVLRRTAQRDRRIPYEAVGLQGRNRGRSMLRWEGREPGVLVFDDSSGEAIALCALPPADDTDIATQCIAVTAYLLQGYVGGVAPGLSLAFVFDRLEHLRAGSSPDCVITAALAREAGAPLAGVKRYTCLLQPTDHDRDASTPRVWSGRPRLAAVRPGTHTCRYAASANVSDNAGHPETYTRVETSLDHQNYLLVEAGACPDGTFLHPNA